MQNHFFDKNDFGVDEKIEQFIAKGFENMPKLLFDGKGRKIFIGCLIFTFLCIAGAGFVLSLHVQEKDVERTVSVKHGAVVAGRPVQWIKVIDLQKAEERGKKYIEIPEEAKDVSVATASTLSRAFADISKPVALSGEERRQLAQASNPGMFGQSQKMFLASVGGARDYLTSLFSRMMTGKNNKMVDFSVTVQKQDGKKGDLVTVQYYTDGPAIDEKNTKKGKEVVVSAPDSLHYQDVTVFTTVPELYTKNQLKNIKIYWKQQNAFVQFDAYDLNDNGLVDYIEWVVPHLSEQTFEIIFISKAFLLDENRNVVEEVYDKVRQKDSVFASFSNNQYARVTFEKKLNNTNDITIYAQSNYVGSRIEVYEQDSDKILAVFNNISAYKKYRILLTNLPETQDVFDLKIIGGVDVDYIVDPDCNEDTICDEGEDCNCSDCGCGEGQVCSGDPASCTTCGVDGCTEGEDCNNCPGDCGCPEGQECSGEPFSCHLYCGNSSCDDGENCSNCEADCGCAEGYNCEGDPASCVEAGGGGETCGNLNCGDGENCSNCSADCGCSEGYNCEGEPPSCVENAGSCGDESCGEGENCSNCSADCGCTAGQQCYGATPSCHDNALIGSWTFSEGEGTTVENSANPGTFDGTLNGGVTWSDLYPNSANASHSVDINRSGENFVSIANLDMPQLTFVAWIKTLTVVDEATIIGSDANGGWVIPLHYGQLAFGNTGVNEAASTQITITDTNWHQIAVSYNGSAVTYYLDGVQKDTHDYSATFNSSDSVYKFGSRDTGVNYALDGNIDGAKLYNYALDSTTITAMYSASCGDGHVVGSEECDDGDNDNGDGCSSTCTEEANYACSGEPSSCEYTDTIPPVPSSFNPASGSTIYDPSPDITFTLDENGDCFASLSDESYDGMSDDYDCSGDGSTSISCNIPDLGAAGSKNVYIACKDTTGNKDTVETNENLTYTLSADPPTRSNISPASGSTINDATQDITLTLSRNGDCRLSLNDESYDAMSDDVDCSGDGSTSITCTTSDLGEDGSKNVYIACQDTYENKDSDSTNANLTYTLDTSIPTASGFSPASGSTITDTTQTITFTTNENATCKVSLTDQPYGEMTAMACTGAGTTSQSCTTPDMGENGEKTVYIACSDGPNSNSADDNNELAYTLFFDGTPPSNCTDDFSSTGWHKSSFNVTFTCTDAISGPGRVYYTLDGSNPADSSRYMTYAESSTMTLHVNQGNGTYCSDASCFVDPADGTYTLKYICRDAQNNWEASSHTSENSVRVDNTKPTTSDNYGDKNGHWQTTSQTITLSASDALSGVSNTRYCIDTSNNCDPFGESGDSYTEPVTLSDAGTKYFRYASQDNAGNQEDALSVTVMIDNVAPVLAEVTPIASNATDTTPAYTFSSTEAGTITYGGTCSSSTTSAVSGSNMIVFNTLAVGTYSNCTITVADSVGNSSSTLTVTSFTIAAAQQEANVGGGGSLWAYYNPPSAPQGGFKVQINDGGQTTQDRMVNLSLTAGTDAPWMIISNTPNFSDGQAKIPYQPSYSFDLCNGATDCPQGQYAVYVRFYTSYFTPSETISSSITLGQTQPLIQDIVQQIKETPQQISDEIKDITQQIGSFSKEFTNLITGPVKQETKVLFPPIEETVTAQAPMAMKGEWQIVPAEKLSQFVFQPLPKSITDLASKFPDFGIALTQYGVTRMSDLSKLQAAGVYLPGLNEATGSVKPVDLSALTKEEKAKIPTGLVFVRGGNGLIDINTKLYVGSKGNPEQAIQTVTGDNLELVFKPESRPKEVKGYLSYLSRNSGLSSKNGVSQVQAASDNVEKQEFVLAQFVYQDDDNDGIYTTNVTVPQSSGEYKVTTKVEYSDKKIKPQELQMITLVDPEGYVYEKSGDRDIPVKGAEVLLYWLNPATSEYEIWPSNDYRQDNPIITGTMGAYSFLVPPGTYYIKVSSPSYITYQSNPFQVKEGNGVHFNIEIKAKYWWMKAGNWQMILLIIIAILLFYDFGCHIRERMRSKAELAARPQKVN